jgi:hypothetical protein
VGFVLAEAMEKMTCSVDDDLEYVALLFMLCPSLHLFLSQPSMKGSYSALAGFTGSIVGGLHFWVKSFCRDGRHSHTALSRQSQKFIWCRAYSDHDQSIRHTARLSDQTVQSTLSPKERFDEAVDLAGLCLTVQEVSDKNSSMCNKAAQHLIQSNH